MKNLYITTTLPYVNASPHLGHALEFVQADVIARYKRLTGFNVFFNTGVDEHGLKVLQKAKKSQYRTTQEYVDYYADQFKQLHSLLTISYSRFIRTTDEDHKKAAQHFWNLCLQNDDIYKTSYKGLYCVGEEMFVTEKDLKDGKCPPHFREEPVEIEEENYFFRFSKYQKPLLDLYTKNKNFVKPSYRLREIKNFVEKGLEDFSISRLKSRLPWGVPVPNDEDHVMYVWFDALVNYISTLGWPSNDTFTHFWPGIQVAGKDNLRQQSAMWQAMLMSAGISNSAHIFIHGFINIEGKKMSKSIGNVIDPIEVINEYGADVLRYYLLREIPGLEDGDFSKSRLDDLYNTELANELGNLVMRITNLAGKDGICFTDCSDSVTYDSEIGKLIESFQFNLALEIIWKKIKALNKSIDQFEPWNKTSVDRYDFLKQSLLAISNIGLLLSPFLPSISEFIQENTRGTIKKAKPLFPRIRNI